MNRLILDFTDEVEGVFYIRRMFISKGLQVAVNKGAKVRGFCVNIRDNGSSRRAEGVRPGGTRFMYFRKKIEVT